MQYKSFFEDIVNEDYPSAWNKQEFEKISSFSGKLKYANTHLQKIASGSARSVFKIDDQKALKIAKNKKGLAQNSVESEPFIQNYDVVARIFDRGDEVQNIGPFWVEMELARKVTPTKFREITGVDFNKFSAYILSVALDKYSKIYDPSQNRQMEENEFVQSILRLLADYDMSHGDCARLSSHGLVQRDGKEAIVLVDFGTTRKVWNDYYRVQL